MDSHSFSSSSSSPGGFATLQMWPSKPGLWQLDTEVAAVQQKGMQTLFLVLDNGESHLTTGQRHPSPSHNNIALWALGHLRHFGSLLSTKQKALVGHSVVSVDR